MSWTEQSSSTAERYVVVDSGETIWDGGDTLWDESVANLARTVWDVGLDLAAWSAQSSTAETWTEV